MWIHSCFVLHHGFQRPQTDENTWPHAFICFSVTGTHNEALALVFNFKYYTGYHSELFFYSPFFVPGIHASTTRGGRGEEF